MEPVIALNESTAKVKQPLGGMGADDEWKTVWVAAESTDPWRCRYFSKPSSRYLSRWNRSAI